jgi:uncharacterized protein YaiI (UPF0178 family)
MTARTVKHPLHQVIANWVGAFAAVIAAVAVLTGFGTTYVHSKVDDAVSNANIMQAIKNQKAATDEQKKTFDDFKQNEFKPFKDDIGKRLERVETNQQTNLQALSDLRAELLRELRK